MKTLLKIEEAAMFGIAVYCITLLPFRLSWWLYIVLFFSPDIGALGYLFNTKTGAFTYNLLHHKAVAILCIAAGIITNSEYILFTGLLLFAHAAFDRVFGYGLKYNDNFKHTSLGMLK